MSFPNEKTTPPTNDSTPTTANIEAFAIRLAARINAANGLNENYLSAPRRPNSTVTISAQPYPQHDNPDHNSLHRYLLDSRNTAEVLIRIRDAPNRGDMSEVFGWLLSVEELRLSALGSRATAVANEETARQLAHTHFQSLVEMGILEYVTPQSPRYTPYTAESPEPQPLQSPISVLVTTTTTVDRSDNQHAPPYAHIQRVDPATLTPSDDEETILPIPPPRYRPNPEPITNTRRRGRSSRTPLFYVGLSGGHINQTTEPPSREARHRPPTPAPRARPTRQQPPSICWECRQMGHTRIHCERYRCPRCWVTAPGHRTHRCPAYTPWPQRNQSSSGSEGGWNGESWASLYDDYDQYENINLDGER